MIAAAIASACLKTPYVEKQSPIAEDIKLYNG
jgi:hypothetical protein